MCARTRTPSNLCTTLPERGADIVRHLQHFNAHVPKLNVGPLLFDTTTPQSLYRSFFFISDTVRFSKDAPLSERSQSPMFPQLARIRLNRDRSGCCCADCCLSGIFSVMGGSTEEYPRERRPSDEVDSCGNQRETAAESPARGVFGYGVGSLGILLQAAVLKAFVGGFDGPASSGSAEKAESVADLRAHEFPPINAALTDVAIFLITLREQAARGNVGNFAERGDQIVFNTSAVAAGSRCPPPCGSGTTVR